MEEFNGFRVTKETHNKINIFIFTFGNTFTDLQFSEFIAILDKLIHSGIKFTFLVDTRYYKKGVPVKSSLALTSWMKKNKSIISQILLGSCVVFSSKFIASLVEAAFKIQKPVAPNKITNDYEIGISFLRHLIGNDKELNE